MSNGSSGFHAGFGLGVCSHAHLIYHTFFNVGARGGGG